MYAAFVSISECLKVDTCEAVHWGLGDTELSVAVECYHCGQAGALRKEHFQQGGQPDRAGLGTGGPTGRALHLHLPLRTDLKLQSQWINTEFLRSCSVSGWGVTSPWKGSLWVLGLSFCRTGLFLFVTEKTASKFLRVSLDPLFVLLFFFLLSFEQFV